MLLIVWVMRPAPNAGGAMQIGCQQVWSGVVLMEVVGNMEMVWNGEVEVYIFGQTTIQFNGVGDVLHTGGKRHSSP